MLLSNSSPPLVSNMAKGRKLTTSRSELFLGTYTYAQTQNQASTATEPSEFREEDVWSMADDLNNVSVSHGEWKPSAAAGRRWVHLDKDNHRHVGGLSLAFEDPGSNATTTSSIVVHQYRGHDVEASPRGSHVASSAPVNVPDWSKILRVGSVESLHDMDDGFDDNESEMVPPHEYLARGRKMEAHSVFEGVGRTLKGRDMRRVRDAVWSQTGFYG